MHSTILKAKAIVHYRHFLRSLRAVAKIYNIGKSTLSRWVNESSTLPRPPRVRRSIFREASTKIAELFQANPFIRLREARDAMEEKGVNMSLSTAYRALKHASFSRKRVQARHCPRSPTKAQITRFREDLRGPSEKISIDETCIYVNDPPRYGYSKRGQRIALKTKRYIRHDRKTVLLAISEERGVIHHMVVNGAANADVFRQFVEGVPASHGAKMIMDNVAFHHSMTVAATLRDKGFLAVYTPPYSPELNPVENAFSVLKEALRRDTSAAFQRSLERVTPSA